MPKGKVIKNICGDIPHPSWIKAENFGGCFIEDPKVNRSNSMPLMDKSWELVWEEVDETIENRRDPLRSEGIPYEEMAVTDIFGKII